MEDSQINPAHILQVGMGFWASKTLLSAVELGLFTELAKAPSTGREIESALGLHSRATYDFLDALVALGFLDREGSGPDARYTNTPETGRFLDRNRRDSSSSWTRWPASRWATSTHSPSALTSVTIALLRTSAGQPGSSPALSQAGTRASHAPLTTCRSCSRYRNA